MAKSVKFGRRGEGSLYQAANGTWYSIIPVPGKQQRPEFSTKTTDLAQAKLFHRQKLDELAVARQGKGEFQTPTQLSVRFGALLDDRIEDYKLNGGKSLWSFLLHAKPVRAHFGDWKAVDIKKRDVVAFINKRLKDGLTAGGVNRQLGIISSTLRLAFSNELIPKLIPIKRLPENNVRQGFFTRAEVESVIVRLPHYLQDFVRFAYFTGWRYSEITGLRWENVDLDAGVVRLLDSKNGHGRVIVLEGELLDLMKRRQAARLVERLGRTRFVDTVFHRLGKPLVRIDTAWDTACKRVGLVGRHFHDLRRSAIRNMVRAGVSETVAMKISGHRSRSVFDRYNITSTDDLRLAAQKTQRYLDTLPTERQT